MNSQDDKHILSEEETIKKELDDLRSRVTNLHNLLPCLKQCSHLSNLLQKVYEIREGLNQLEQKLLHTHLQCCISPSLKVPGDVVIALSKLSEKRHGAIIIIEQKDSLDAYLKGGVAINSSISAPILENIFYPGSPLHDGAVVIRNTKILKASCVLPLSPYDPELEALRLGTRHRAAIGISQVSDALVIVVSEEKGWISLALQGQFYPNLGTFALLKKLEG